MSPIQIVMLLALALSARAWLAGCDFFLGHEDAPASQPTPFETWKERR